MCKLRDNCAQPFFLFLCVRVQGLPFDICALPTFALLLHLHLFGCLRECIDTYNKSHPLSILLYCLFLSIAILSLSLPLCSFFSNLLLSFNIKMTLKVKNKIKIKNIHNRSAICMKISLISIKLHLYQDCFLIFYSDFFILS